MGWAASYERGTPVRRGRTQGADIVDGGGGVASEYVRWLLLGMWLISGWVCDSLQGYLAHENPPPPRTLQ